MVQENKKQLYNLSNQMIDLFIKDIFSKNKADLEKAKTNMSDEQRATLKQSVTELQGQVESFLNDKNASKTITENNQTNTSENISPLRKKFSKKNETDNEIKDMGDKEDTE